MANENPIYTGKDGDFVYFNIPHENLNDTIKLSITVDLLDAGWKYDSDHIISLQGNSSDLYNDGPEPDKLPIGSGTDIINKKFRIYSHITRIRDGAPSDQPSRVKYALTFFANDRQLDQFTNQSDRSNPFDFISDIQFA